MSGPVCDGDLRRIHERACSWEDGKDHHTILIEKGLVRGLLARLDAVEKELELWKPMTPEEAEAAMDAADAVPMSREEIDRIVEKITDPSYTPSNTECGQLAADFRRAKERCECGAFGPDPTPCEKQPCGCVIVRSKIDLCPLHAPLGYLPDVRYSDGTIHHFDEDGNFYAESGPKPSPAS